MSNQTTIWKKLRDSAGLLTLVAILGLVLGLGLRNCSPLSTPKITVKDSVSYNLTIIDSTFIKWDTQTYTVKNPVPSVVSASTNKKPVDPDRTNTSNDTPVSDCVCETDSVRIYTGKIPISDYGFVFYNLKAIGTITDMNFTNSIGVQNSVRIVESDTYKSKETTIDTTPFLRVYAGAEFNPMQLRQPSIFADAALKKWVIGYRYEIGVLNPHNVKVGFKIFDL